MGGETCAVVTLLGNGRDVAKSIGSTPEYPTSTKRTADAVLLLRATTMAGIGDMIEVAGVKLRVVGISASYDTVGKFAHCVAEAMLWKFP